MMTRTSSTAAIAALVLGAFLAPVACVGPSTNEIADASQHAQCLVCKSEGDLACVDVRVKSDTPRTTYKGATYYFCSDQCRKDFEKDPERYLAR